MESTVTQHKMLIDILISASLYFAIAGIVVPLLQRAKISPVLSYLICGIVIGPYGIAKWENTYSWISYISVSDSSSVYLIGELGIITLMFKIGLELSIARLIELKKYIFGLGTLQILVSAIVIFLIARSYENSIEASILIGASFALSSTAIVMKLLEENKLSNRPIGILCFSILLMQDLAVIPILILSSIFASGDLNVFFAIGKSLFFGIITMLSIYLVGKKVLAPLLRNVSISTTHEWLTAIVVFLVLFFSLITYKSGLSLALGAFVIGLLIAETEFSHEVKIVISPIKGVLLGIFFLSIGMMINIVEIINNFYLISMSVVGIFLLKFIILSSLCLIFKVPLPNSIQAAVYLSEPGEFALMILGTALAGGVIPADDVTFFILVTVVAMMLAPFVFKIGPVLYNYINSLAKQDKKKAPINLDKETGYIVIAGFGKVGKLIADALTQQMIPYIAFDVDGQIVQEAKSKNYMVNYGDVRLNNFWNYLNSQNIDLAIIAIGKPEATKLTISSARKNFPNLPIFVRSQDNHGLQELYDLGASKVIPESLESSLRIARMVMENLGVECIESDKVISSIREKVLNP